LELLPFFHQIFIQHFFKIVLYWCLDPICHNIGTHLKLNKYIFDISIPFMGQICLRLDICCIFFIYFGSTLTTSHNGLCQHSHIHSTNRWSAYFLKLSTCQELLSNWSMTNLIKIKSLLYFLFINYLAFQSLDFECTWWRLFQKRVVHTNFDIYEYRNIVCNEKWIHR
jgi:hypothetical protein